MGEPKDKLAIIRLWKDYGEWRSLVVSPYLWMALGVAIIYTIKLVYMKESFSRGAGVAISVTPSLLGFSLGGFAVFLSFGGERFQRYLIETNLEKKGANGQPVNLYMDFVATFGWFLLIQTLSLGLASVLSGWEEQADGYGILRSFHFFNIWLFYYSLALVVAICLRIYVLCRGYSTFTKINNK